MECTFECLRGIWESVVSVAFDLAVNETDTIVHYAAVHKNIHIGSSFGR